jgi:hypothetical protein
MLRYLIFYIGLFLMALSLLFPIFPIPPNDRWNRAWLFDLGLLMALGAHGWPGGL